MEKHPLAVACINGNLDQVKQITASEETIHSEPLHWEDSEGKELKSPAIFIAIDYGHTEIVQYLLEAGTPVELCDDNDYTVLQWASWTGHLPSVTALIEAGAKVDEEALDLAKENGHKEVADLLMQKVDLYSMLDDVDEVMEKACRQGDLAKVKQLMEEGYDYQKWKDEDGNYYKYSPMFMALKFGHLDIIQVFTEVGITVPQDEVDS